MTTKQKIISSRFVAGQSGSPKFIYDSSQLSFISEVRLRLQDGRYKLVNYNCPCESEKEDIIISEVDRYGLPLNSVMCMKCGTVRLDPYLDESSLEDFYTNFYQQMYGRAIDLDSYFLKQKNYGEKVLSVAQTFLKPESWVCEVGCGAGGALKVFQDRGYNVAGCDYSRELIRAGNQKNVKNLYDGSLDTLGSHLSGIKFDLIYLHHVFEHTNDPLSFLENCRKYLAPKGKIIIAVPDISKIDVSKACPGDLLAYLHLAHKYNFSFECLRRMCGITEYSLTRLSPDSSIITHCSILSELWVQLTIENDKNCEEPNNNLLLNEPGTRLIRYLKLTEKLYSLGLTKGQLLHKLSSSLGYVKTFLQKSKNYVFSFF